MIDAVDRLPDWAYTESELLKRAKLVVNPNRNDTTAKHLCWYMLYKNGMYTGKGMLLAVESVVDGQKEVNKLLEPVGLTTQIGEYGDESVLNTLKVEMLYTVLDKYKYTSKIDFIGCEKVFNYEIWMAKLL